MAKTTTPAIEFRDPPPPRSNGAGGWLSLLAPLLNHKGRWAMVKGFDNPDLAHNAASNLNRRKVRIPEPDHDWGFASRDCELFAIYRGPTRQPTRRRRRS